MVFNKVKNVLLWQHLEWFPTNTGSFWVKGLVTEDQKILTTIQRIFGSYSDGFWTFRRKHVYKLSRPADFWITFKNNLGAFKRIVFFTSWINTLETKGSNEILKGYLRLILVQEYFGSVQENIWNMLRKLFGPLFGPILLFGIVLLQKQRSVDC